MADSLDSSAAKKPAQRKRPPGSNAPIKTDGALIGARAAQVGGLALAAYVITAVTTGSGVASADTADADAGGSVTSSSQHAANAATTNRLGPRAGSRTAANRPARAGNGATSSATTPSPKPRPGTGGFRTSSSNKQRLSSPSSTTASSDSPADATATTVVAAGLTPVGLPAPMPPQRTAVDWAPLTWIRRTFFNRPPTVHYRASLNSQDMSNGVITGTIGAIDPDGDRLTYQVLADPKYGSVVIDPLTGKFTFTPTALFAEFGGADAFTVKVTDGRFHPLALLFSPDRGTPTPRLPVAVTRLPDASPSSPLEPFTVEKVITFDVPDGVVVNGADLTPDGDHLLLSVTIAGKTQIAVSNLDGGEYQCVSCGLVTNAAKAIALEGNQKIWFASTSGQQSADDPLGGAGLISYAILECQGSISSCANPTVKNVEFPSDRGPLAASTQNREAKPDPFGEYVTWTENTPITGPRMSIARLVATDTGYKLVDQRIFAPQWDENTEYAQDFANATRFYEGGSWHAGGRYLKYQTTTTGLNYDIYLLDTLTGERRQLTTDLDYNESGDVAPDGRSVYFSSARGADRMDVFTALQRPSLLDVAAFPQMARVSLWNNRRAMNEPWVMNLDDGQQLGSYSGQPVIIDPDWTIRGWSWFPDSTRALINEQQRPDTVTPGAPDTPWRFSIISFPTREATTPLPPVHQDPDAIAKWSVPVEEYTPMMGRQVPSRVLQGKDSGTATLSYSGTFASGSYSVTYDNYSDDGKTFINGTEKVTVVNPIGNATWTADLTSTGERTGYLKGSIKAGKANAFSGTVSSEINGVSYSGVPIQTDFPVINQPQLAITSFDNRVRVTATVAEDGYPRAVRGATVTVGSNTVTTDENGFAQIPFVPGDTISVIAGGFQSASQQVPTA
ncbi:Ig-like domain-containing protein [Mycolicibacterium aichiense]|uniref:WD40 domain-containing protein n=2 Tax=Mycolicibacterium TaxID=1866885 RepID=A0AAD1HRA0_9MYCO|nr:Ig-like domain-containing protein [Mycolicibacterium aichiense]MCV7017296.1 hypothetical protein [Mycolicibacterium aichiense]BBX10273.1 hypothetical protein MAIC_50760 [Mycolicibacterium aichiense]STZ26066.1 WD40 domain-containing protein [Mycolicibacterium aichiense]